MWLILEKRAGKTTSPKSDKRAREWQERTAHLVRREPGKQLVRLTRRKAEKIVYALDRTKERVGRDFEKSTAHSRLTAVIMGRFHFAEN